MMMTWALKNRRRFGAAFSISLVDYPFCYFLLEEEKGGGRGGLAFGYFSAHFSFFPPSQGKVLSVQHHLPTCIKYLLAWSFDVHTEILC